MNIPPVCFAVILLAPPLTLLLAAGCSKDGASYSYVPRRALRPKC